MAWTRLSEPLSWHGLEARATVVRTVVSVPRQRARRRYGWT
ncbi:MAG: hypothetical protein RMK45_04340 [Armatimonadota bacterium]|nr:hypothetical protein [Armatimonadota bacterium]